MADKVTPPTLRDALNWVKGATSLKDVEPYMGHYRFLPDAGVEAYDGRTLAFCPMDPAYLPPLPRLVSAEALDKFLSKIKPDAYVKVKWTDTKAIWTAGNVRMETSTLDHEMWPFPHVTEMTPSKKGAEIPWQPWTQEHTFALQVLSPFISDNAQKLWATCLIHRTPYAYASNNVVLARVDFPDVVAKGAQPEAWLWPKWALNFITARQEGLSHWTVQDGNFWLAWKDGKRARCTGVAAESPALSAVAAPLDTLDVDDLPELTEDWKEAYRLTVSMVGNDTTLRILADAIEGGDEQTLVRHEVEMFEEILQPAAITMWDPNFLTDVIDGATHWDPGTYPKYTLFARAETSFRGIIVGRVA